MKRNIFYLRNQICKSKFIDYCQYLLIDRRLYRRASTIFNDKNWDVVPRGTRVKKNLINGAAAVI